MMFCIKLHPDLGQPIGAQPADEILAIRYPSQQAFLALRRQPGSAENFRLRNLVIASAVIQRCRDGGIASPI